MKFYALGSNFCEDGSQFFLEVDESTPTGDAARCPVCGNFYGLIPYRPPIRGRLVAERSVVDFSASGDSALLSERCAELFREFGVRGLGIPAPVEIIDIEGPRGLDRTRRFYLADVALWGGEVDRIKSGLRTAEKVACQACGCAGLIDGYDGIHLIEDSWKGDDIFTIKGLPGTILVSERIEALCRVRRLSVCSLRPAVRTAMGGLFRASLN